MVEEVGLLKNEVVKVSLGESANNSLLNLGLIIDEWEVTIPLEGCLLDKFFTSTMPNAKCVHSLIYTAFLADQIDYLLCVPDCSVSQQIYMRCLNLCSHRLEENILQRFVDLCTPKVWLKLGYFLNGCLQRLVVVVYAAYSWKHELMATPIAADVELATSW